MNVGFRKNQIAIAVAAAISTAAAALAPSVATAAKAPGKYVAGDVHNHTTCSDGSISMRKLVKKATDKIENGGDTPWGLDWFVQAGHGGNGNRNCTLVEDATLATPAYPYLTGATPFNPVPANPQPTYNGPQTLWSQTIGTAAIKGVVNGCTGTAPNLNCTNQNMWRWQSIQEFQYPLIEYLNAYLGKPLFLGIETVNPGHEHTSMSVITGQIPLALDNAQLPTTPGYTAIGSGTALAQWEYCFDRNDADTSRGGANNWNCAVPGSLNASDPSWNATAMKLVPAGGTGTGTRGHNKSLEALKWMQQFAPNESYYLPTHLERAGPFNPDGNNGFNIENLRNFNNTAPRVAFGFETQPGHGASANRGEYQINRNTFPGNVLVDSVGGTTYGGTGVYGAQVGGVWDALLGEGRNWWFFASSDWHTRSGGSGILAFGPDDRRSSQDFLPGEYQRSYVMVRNGADKLRPQTIVDGMRSGNVFTTSGQLIDRLAFVACASYPGVLFRSDAAVEAMATKAAFNQTDTDTSNCATMGEKLKVRQGAEIVVTVVLRDPDGTNYSPYTFENPSLKQITVSQPINAPVLDHVDLIRGEVSGYKTPGAPDYSGEWPRNTAWLKADGTTTGLSSVPDAAKNLTAAVIKTFNANGAAPWTAVTSNVDGTTFLKMTYRIPAVTKSQYVRLRGTNMRPGVPFETDADGNPLADVYTNANDTTRLAIPCTAVHSANSQFDGCPDHMPTATGTSPIAGQKAVAYDVAAWADLWFYANPIYVEVAGSTPIAGVQ